MAPFFSRRHEHAEAGYVQHQVHAGRRGRGFVYFQGTDSTLWRVPVAATKVDDKYKLGGYHTSSTRPACPATAYVYFRGTDSTLWRVPVTATKEDDKYKLGGYKCSSTPCVPDDGYVYFQGTDSTLWRVPMAATKEDDKYKLGGYKCSSTPCVPGDGHVYFRGTDSTTLWRVPGRPPQRRWTTRSTNSAATSAALTALHVPGDSYVYFQGTDSTLWRVPETATRRWTQIISSAPTAPARRPACPATATSTFEAPTTPSGR